MEDLFLNMKNKSNERGLFTPSWWFPNWNQYGMLKLIVVNQEGTFIDGLKISEVSTKDIMIYHARPYEEIIGDPLYDPNRHARKLTVLKQQVLHSPKSLLFPNHSLEWSKAPEPSLISKEFLIGQYRDLKSSSRHQLFLPRHNNKFLM